VFPTTHQQGWAVPAYLPPKPDEYAPTQNRETHLESNNYAAL
jgi:hypothetical protein